MGIIVLLMNATWQCNAQDTQSRRNKEAEVVGTSSQNVHAVTADTFPSGKIRMKPPPTSSENCLFVFYDKNGNVSKEITDKDLPAYSKFKSLDLPRIREQGGEPIKEQKGGLIKYNLRDLIFTKRKEVLQRAGVRGVPDSVIRRATDITYFGNPVYFRDGYWYNYIITGEVSRFFDEEGHYPIYTCFDQTHISIFDSTGNVTRQLDVNHSVSNTLISDDGRYLLMIFNKYHRYDADTYDIPLQIFDLYTNKTDTIDLKVFDNMMPLYLMYDEGFFQILMDGKMHLMINPIERRVYYRTYDASKFELLGNGYKFKSKHLPDGKKVNFYDYQMRSY